MAKFNLGASGDAIRLFLIVWAPTQRPLPIGRRSKDPPWGLAARVCRSPQARRRSDEEPFIREPLCVEIGTHLFPLSAWFDGRGHWPGCDPLRVLHRVFSSIAVSVGPVRFSLDTFWALVGPLTRPSQMGSGGNLKWTGELQRDSTTTTGAAAGRWGWPWDRAAGPTQSGACPTGRRRSIRVQASARGAGADRGGGGNGCGAGGRRRGCLNRAANCCLLITPPSFGRPLHPTRGGPRPRAAAIASLFHLSNHLPVPLTPDSHAFPIRPTHTPRCTGIGRGPRGRVRWASATAEKRGRNREQHQRTSGG